MNKIYFVAFACGLVWSCTSTKKQTAVQDNCKDLPKLRWQTEYLERKDSSFLNLSTDLAAAARFDADLSKRISDSVGVKFQSQLAKKMSTVANSAVSQDFWEIDILFRQLACYYEKQLIEYKNDSLMKNKFQELYFSVLSSRNIYLDQRQKKTSLTK